MPKRIDGQNDEFHLPQMPGKAAVAIRIRLDAGKSAHYDVWQKELPETLPKKHPRTQKDITWHNNYGLKKRKNGKDSGDADDFELAVDDEYTLEIDAEPSTTYVYHDGTDVIDIPIINGKATIRLKLGDPAVGGTSGG